MSSVSVVLSAGGRTFAIIDEGPLASIYLPSRWSLTARDAFNGVLLWRRPIPSWQSHLWSMKNGPMELTRRLVVTDDYVYAVLGLDAPVDAPVSKIDAVTGEIVATYDDVPHAEELLWVDDKLVIMAGVATNAKPFRPLIPYSRKGLQLNEFSIGGSPEKVIAVIDCQQGKLLWRQPWGKVTPGTLVADDKQVAFLVSTSVQCLDIESG